jgi:hypothetical protein
VGIHRASYGRCNHRELNAVLAHTEYSPEGEKLEKIRRAVSKNDELAKMPSDITASAGFSAARKACCLVVVTMMQQDLAVVVLKPRVKLVPAPL